MRCSICGAKLKKEGDICKNCYKEIQEQKKIDSDKKVVYKINRDYKIDYEIVKNMELIIILAVCTFLFVYVKAYFQAIVTFIFLIVAFFIVLLLDKRVARATSITFYETKAVYRFKFWFINKEKTLKYEDIKSISYFNTFRQGRMGFGDVCFYAKGSIPGVNLLNGFQIKGISNVKEKVEQMKKIVGI